MAESDTGPFDPDVTTNAGMATQPTSGGVSYGVFVRCLALCELVVRLGAVLTSRMRFRGALRYLYKPRGDDVFIVSYPKAGTTVMQMLAFQVAAGGDHEFRHIDDVVPWFERRLLANPADLDGRPSPRLFKTHLTIDRLPRNAKYIYLVREPKDSCVSYYHHLRSLSGARAPLDAFVSQFARGHVPMGSWFEHLRACTRALGARRVLVVIYDDIVRKREQVIDQVAEFCGVTLTPEQKQRVVERSSFSYMKENNAKFDPRLAAGTLHLEETQFVRRGVVGSWMDDLTPTQARRIDEQLDALLRDSSVSLPASVRQALQPSSPPVKGGLLIDMSDREKWSLIRPADSPRPSGVRVRGCEEAVSVGDVIQLILVVREERLTVARAGIGRVADDGELDILFRDMDAQEETRLMRLLGNETPPPDNQESGSASLVAAGIHPDAGGCGGSMECAGL